MKQLDMEVIAGFMAQLQEVNSGIAIVPHVNADGDAIGSALALAGILKKAGKDVVVIVPNHFPAFYKWMKGCDDVVVFTAEPKRAVKLIKEAGMMICLDYNQPSRAGDMSKLVETFRGRSIVIDHHLYPQRFTELLISQPECSSTAELLFHVIQACGYGGFIDRHVAECFFCGIMTDTGSFDYNVSDPQTFETVSHLLTYGIDPEGIHDNVFNNYSVDRTRLLGYCLNECMEVYPEFNTVMMYLSKETQKRYNFEAGDNEGFVNYPLTIKGVCFSALFTEKEDHIKASFRSKGMFSVNDFASTHFNGGGHRNASGGEVNASLEETLRKFRDLLPEYGEQLRTARRPVSSQE